MDSETVHLEREALHELVWSEPMVRLARRFRLSNVDLAKICRRMGIPLPPRGYWRRRELAFGVGQQPLPEAGPGTPLAVEFRLRDPADELSTPSPEVENRLASERRPENRIEVPARLGKAHALVRATAAALRVRRAGPRWTPPP
jgi:hypothetical protein